MLIRFTLLFLPIFMFIGQLYAQADSVTITSDTTQVTLLKGVLISCSFGTGISAITNADAVVDIQTLELHPANSLLGAINTVPGVRMEERSPGSYRLSIRGSVLRSPFGVRNVKVYMAGMPLTDGSGNSYLNVIDPTAVGNIQILKGPDASIYGANTGGVVLIDPLVNTQNPVYISGMVQGGSYGYVQARALYQQKFKRYTIQASQSYMRSNGYRQNTAMQQLSTQVYQRWQYNDVAELKVYLLYTNLRYRTPGGLTQQQFDDNPRQARPATPTLPSAVEQQAGIVNSTVFAGIGHDVEVKTNLRHVITVAFSHTDFKNPFITNYEVRSEQNLNARTYLLWSNYPADGVEYHWMNGLEAQQSFSTINNYKNNKGAQGDLIQAYKFKAGNYFAFSRFTLVLLRRVNVQGSLSLNYNGYWYRSMQPVQQSGFKTNFFKPQLMPRLGVSVLISQHAVWRASVSRGFSAPTLAEVYPSANNVSLNLQPEAGWSYETGIRLRDTRDIVNIDIAGYYFALANTIVVRSDTAGNTYFVNAGGTKQWGFEASVSLFAVRSKHVSLKLNSSYTFAHYRFSNYTSGTDNYSGNMLTGVPPHTVVSSAHLLLPKGIYVFAEHNYTHSLPVNDANTVYAKAYHLLQFKVGWKYTIKGLVDIHLFAGMQNALNQKYSLGNDLNAVGGRYFNAAPPRNYYGGIIIGGTTPVKFK